MGLTDRLVLALDMLLHGPPAAVRASERATLPPRSPLKSAKGHAARTEAALRMMDEDCYGFLLFTLHREKVGVCAEIRIAEHLHPTWWPAITETLERVAVAERAERPGRSRARP
jgi:hypothetical protein